jgi:hypothetical protein
MCAGVNRYEVENAKFLRERTSDPLGPESCAATARDTVKRRQGYRRGGRLSCENIQPGRRRSINVRKATCAGAIARVSVQSGVVEDPRHA